MKTKIGYYPLLDTALAIRQIFSTERFKPFAPALLAVDGKLGPQERDQIHHYSEPLDEWLEPLCRLIDLTLSGITSPEEILLRAEKDPTLLLGARGDVACTELVSNIHYTHCAPEIGRHTLTIRKKAQEIAAASEKGALLGYILSLSDRFVLEDGETIRFNIKPDLKVKISDIDHIIVMPSVFSSRNVSFWYSGNSFVFFVGLESRTMSLEEPSDMLLLRTLAFNDKTRLKLLRMLGGSALSVNEMADRLGMNASTVSRHLKVFKDAGFVDIQSQDGNSVYYCLNEKELKKASETILNYILGT